MVLFAIVLLTVGVGLTFIPRFYQYLTSSQTTIPVEPKKADTGPTLEEKIASAITAAMAKANTSAQSARETELENKLKELEVSRARDETERQKAKKPTAAQAFPGEPRVPYVDNNVHWVVIGGDGNMLTNLHLNANMATLCPSHVLHIDGKPVTPNASNGGLFDPDQRKRNDKRWHVVCVAEPVLSE